MTKTVRSHVVLALVLAAGSVCFAEAAGEATYKTKCQTCHGVAGVPPAALAKMMNIKAVTDPEIKKLTTDSMIATVKNGKGKMKPVAGLTDPQIKDAVLYYKSMAK
jgi:mono/diheme cytochrome c family protein